MRANLHRRQLNDNQRAMVGAKIEPMFAALAKERQRDGAKARAEGPRDEKGRLAQVQVISPEPGGTAPKPPAPQARKVQADFPYLTLETLQAVMAWYEENRQEIDDILRARRERYAQRLAQSRAGR